MLFNRKSCFLKNIFIYFYYEINGMKKSRRTYDTDRYEIRYHISEEATVHKSVWASPAYVGPKSYNNSHVDKVLNPINNDAHDVSDAAYNPFMANRSLQSEENAKFRP